MLLGGELVCESEFSLFPKVGLVSLNRWRHFRKNMANNIRRSEWKSTSQCGQIGQIIGRSSFATHPLLSVFQQLAALLSAGGQFGADLASGQPFGCMYFTVNLDDARGMIVTVSTRKRVFYCLLENERRKSSTKVNKLKKFSPLWTLSVWQTSYWIQLCVSSITPPCRPPGGFRRTLARYKVDTTENRIAVGLYALMSILGQPNP